MVHKLWQEIDIKDRDFVVSYNRKVKNNEYTDEIDVLANFWSLFKNKYSTNRVKQYRPRRKVIFNLHQYDKDE